MLHCLKITEKVSFNIASSYVYIWSWQKLIKNAKWVENTKLKNSNETFCQIFKQYGSGTACFHNQNLLWFLKLHPRIYHFILRLRLTFFFFSGKSEFIELIIEWIKTDYHKTFWEVEEGKVIFNAIVDPKLNRWPRWGDDRLSSIQKSSVLEWKLASLISMYWLISQ